MATKIFKIPEGADRMDIPVTLCKLSDKQIGKYSTFRVVARTTIDESNTELKAFQAKLEAAKQKGDEKLYADLKKELPAMIIGKFSNRENEACEIYVPLLGFDIDKIGDSFLLDATLNELKKDPYVWVAFPSPSRRGIRFFVLCESTPETHKFYYSTICEYYSKVLNIPTGRALRAQGETDSEVGLIDTSTNNLARHWLISHVPLDSYYFNHNSSVFTLPEERPRPHTSHAPEIIGDDEKIQLCLEKVNRQSIPAGRNNFVFAFASELCRHGVNVERALTECLTYKQADFDEKEIEKTVESAYKTTPFGEFQDAQIAKYKAMIKGGATAATQNQPVKKQPLEKKLVPQPRAIGERADVLFPVVSPPSMTDKKPSLDGNRTKRSLKLKKAEKGMLYEWIKINEKGIPIRSDISNFIMLPLYLLKHNRNAKRIFEVINIYNERATICIPVKNMVGVDGFKAEMEGKGNFVPKWNKEQFDALKEAFYFQEQQAEEIDTLGWQSAHGVYSFANGIFDGKKFYQIDEFGIAHTPKGRFYIPAFSNVNENGAAEYANERKFRFEPGSLSLGEWSETICRVYGDNGKIGICYMLACLFRDIIFHSLDCFPILFLFAPPQSGKSTYRDSFLSLFGEPQVPISLEGASSPKGFSRKLAQFSNALIVFEEYKNRISPALIGMLKNLYDGIGYERAQMTNDNKTHATPVLSGCMVAGQEVPTKENALFTRVLMIELAKTTWSEEERAEHDRLKSAENQGLGTVLLQILQHRQPIEQSFKTAFDEAFKDLRKDHSCLHTTDRHIKNAAAILAPFKILAAWENLPFTYAEALKIVAQRLKEQGEMMTRTNEVNQFWDAFHYLRSDHRLSVEKHFKYGEEKGQKLLYLIFNQVHPVYNEYMTKQGLNALEQETLLRYLKQQSYFLTPQQLDSSTKELKDCKKVGWSSRRAYLFKADAEPVIEQQDEI